MDPRRVYPLIGPAQQHHAHYKCIVYYEDVRHIGWPVPYTIRDDDSEEVIYVDHNHLHMVGNVDTGAGAHFWGTFLRRVVGECSPEKEGGRQAPCLHVS